MGAAEANSATASAPDVGTVNVDIDPVPGKSKLHGRAFYESIGSPKYVVAPMVNQSEFAWRMLTRSFLSPAENAQVLAYTPMMHARLYNDGEPYRQSNFQAVRPPASSSNTDTGTDMSTASTPWLDGNPSIDRPLFVQFCANDPDTLLAAARRVAPYCDAVDLNLGCPQGIARKGQYGAFLQEDQDLVFRLINTLHRNLDVPVTAKIRVLDTREATLAYARNVLRAGASILTVHGRRREQKGHLTGLADWSTIRWLRERLPPETVMLANGNVLQRADLDKCLEATGADGVMSAEGNLSDPALFAEPPPTTGSEVDREYWRGRDGRGGWRVDAVVRRYLDILHRHVADREPPVRKPLFVPGDEKTARTGARTGEYAEDDDSEQPARKKQKKMDEGADAEHLAKEETSTRETKKSKKEKKKQLKKNGKTNDPNLGAVQAHLFHLLRHFVSRHTDVRDKLARSFAGDFETYEEILAMIETRVAEGLEEYERTGGRMFDNPDDVKQENRHDSSAGKEVVDQGEKKTKTNGSVTLENSETGARRDQDAQDDDDAFDEESSVAVVRKCRRPWWVAQPIVRPLPKEAMAKGAVSMSKKEKSAAGEKGEAAAAATPPSNNGGDDVQRKVLETDDQLIAG